MIYIEWAQLKNYVDSKNLSIQYIEKEDEYQLYASEGSVIFYHLMSKSPTDTTELSDFENNYKNVSNQNLNIYTSTGVKSPKNMRARIVGSHYSTIAAGQSQDLDWQIPNLQWAGSSKQTYFDGIEYFAKNAEMGDTASFQVVDVDGVLYPPGTVLEEFATDTYIFPDIKEVFRLYKAKLIPGLYIRIKYNSTGASAVEFICNLMRHLDQSKNI